MNILKLDTAQLYNVELTLKQFLWLMQQDREKYKEYKALTDWHEYHIKHIKQALDDIKNNSTSEE